MSLAKLSRVSLLNIIILVSAFTLELSNLNADSLITKQPIIDFYDKEALMYDDGYDTPLCRAEDKILMSLIEPIILNKKVLDIGCGTGIVLNYFQIKEYLGIDISPKMIEVAVDKYPNNFFMVGDMEQLVLSIPSNSFDSIICLFGPLSYAINPVDLLQEFYRILTPGGSLVLMPYTKRVEYKFIIGGYNTASQDGINKTYYSTEMAEALMAETEFVDVDIKGINYFGNFIETMDTFYDNQNSYEFYYQLLLNEQNLTGIVLPIEYARHSMITARKP
jgi:ubiquinone/menaquinone biosynthesis C-methylase UbiE